MKLVNPMKYIVIEERTPAHEAIKGRQPNRCMIIFDARLSPTLVCAGITQREHEILSDGSIVEEGDWKATEYSKGEVESIRHAAQQALKGYEQLRKALNANAHETLDSVINRIEQLRQDSESLARVNEVLKATESRLNTPYPPVKVGAVPITHKAIWEEGHKAGMEGEGVSDNPYVDGYNTPFVEAHQWEAGRQAAIKSYAHIR